MPQIRLSVLVDVGSERPWSFAFWKHFIRCSTRPVKVHRPIYEPPFLKLDRNSTVEPISAISGLPPTQHGTESHLNTHVRLCRNDWSFCSYVSALSGPWRKFQFEILHEGQSHAGLIFHAWWSKSGRIGWSKTRRQDSFYFRMLNATKVTTTHQAPSGWKEMGIAIPDWRATAIVHTLAVNKTYTNRKWPFKVKNQQQHFLGTITDRH